MAIIGYIRNWGNDENDGLTKTTAKRTLQGAKDAGLTGDTSNHVSISGFYNEQTALYGIFGEGYLMFDGSLLGDFIPGIQGSHLENAIVQNYTNFSPANRYYRKMINCIVRNVDSIGNSIEAVNNKIDNLFYNIVTVRIHQPSSIYSFSNNTKKCTNLNFLSTYFGNGDLRNSIYCADQILVQAPFTFLYSLFIGGTYMFNGGGLGNDETVYTAPTGVDDTAKLENLRSRMATVYGGVAADYLIGCKYYSGSYNNIFVDADNGDFNLVPFCIAAHMSYDGDYIGARLEGIKADWDTDFSNTVNIDAIGNISDQNTDATTQTNIMDFGHIRTVLNFQALGDRAARNGQQINSEVNLGSNISAGSNVLVDNTVYMCVDDIITRDDSSATGQIPWDTFTAIDEGGGVGLGFSDSGTVKEVYIDDRYEEKIQFKSSKTDAVLSAAVLLNHKLHSDPILVNVDGVGEPTHGNLDVGYNEGTAIPLRSRYIQFFIKIKSNNLPAR